MTSGLPKIRSTSIGEVILKRRKLGGASQPAPRAPQPTITRPQDTKGRAVGELTNQSSSCVGRKLFL
jgi:hypothetical protein